MSYMGWQHGSHISEKDLIQQAWSDKRTDTMLYNFNSVYRRERDKMLKNKNQEQIFATKKSFYFNFYGNGISLKNPIITAFTQTSNSEYNDEVALLGVEKIKKLNRPEQPIGIDISLKGLKPEYKPGGYTEQDILKDVDNQEMLKAMYNKLKTKQ